MRTAPRRARLLALLAACLAAFATGAAAETQRLSVREGWNLVSFAVVPEDPAPAAVLAPLGTNLEALWSYDAATDVWSRFPQVAPGAPTIQAVEPGRGYWLESTVAMSFDVQGEDGALAPGPEEIAPAWNLVGFPLVEGIAYERVVTNASIRQIWTFDAEAGAFVGVVIDAQGLVVREDFIDLLPGRGYWLFSNAATSLAPELRTSLPTDVDVPPLLETAAVGESVAWTNISQGDVDVGRDGNYDRTLTQRAFDFEERIFQHRLSIANAGSGVLAYQVAVADPEGCAWLRILETDQTGESSRVVQTSGSITSERVRIQLVALREGLGIGEYECDLVVRSNGAGLDDTERTLTAFMGVGGLDGDYRLRVALETVDGKAADLANPRITLSLYEDAGGLKAIIDSGRTLLFPTNAHLAGRLIESGTTRFDVSGSFEVPAGAPGNPFGSPLRRDITLRGERVDRAAADGTIIGSLDLAGEYFETLRGVTPEPINLRGSFTGERLGSIATARDRADPDDRTSGDVPDEGILERMLTVDEQLLIDEVEVTVNIAHERPADLVVTLIAPDTREVVLRRRSPAGLLNQIFDEFATPLESLAAFEGQLAQGDWTLRIEDQVAGEVGTLLDWALDVRGTEIHAIAATAPPNTLVVLTGCGRTELATSDAAGAVSFTGLIDCVYRLGVYDAAFGVGQQDVVVAGQDAAPTLAPPARAPGPPRDFDLPAGAQAVFVSLTTSGGAGATQPRGELQYAYDAATYDLDRPPLGSLGPEDSNEFLGLVDGITRSNRPGMNGSIDGPVGENSLRITVNLGLPVVGPSVQGDLRLSAGANP
jgi:subtilisin-like proprotein convertase family protein